MGKISRTKKLNQGLQVHLVSKNECGKQKVQIKKTEIGKPSGLGKIRIKEPNIWSTKKEDINFIRFLINEGRHLLLHFAGAKKNLKNEKDLYKRMIKQEKYNEQKSNQPLYEFLETFSKNNLGNLQKNKNKERIVVFFFRNNCLSTLGDRYPKISSLINANWNTILKDIKFLLDEIFYLELIELLKQLESNFDIEIITNNLIEQFLKTNQLEFIQVIFKNLLIQIFKGRNDPILYWDKVQNLSSETIFQFYKERIILYKDQIILFNGESLDFYQDLQYQNLEKDVFQDFHSQLPMISQEYSFKDDFDCN